MRRNHQVWRTDSRANGQTDKHIPVIPPAPPPPPPPPPKKKTLLAEDNKTLHMH